jgi:DNA invertase Pin-like site-specific DNA recombinase
MTDVQRYVKIAAIYARVSTEEQTVANQIVSLERAARERDDLRLVFIFGEQISALAKKRPSFERMMEHARAGKFSVLYVWALDRLGRSMLGIANTIQELDKLGVEVVSSCEPWLSTMRNAHGIDVREFLICVFGWVAQMERKNIVARTKAGQARARKEGKRIGRPDRMSAEQLARAVELAKAGDTHRVIAQKINVSRPTVTRFLAQKRSHLKLVGDP